jgi:UDP-glucose 4-epimerase
MKTDFHCENICCKELENTKVLVTGGAGFVGSSLCFALVKNGARVTVLDDLFTGSLSHLEGISLDFIEGSVVNAELLNQVLATNFDYIFHLAARNIIVSTRDPLEDFEVNARGTLNLLLGLRRVEHPKLKRLVYSSTASVYGNPDVLPLNEQNGVAMLSPYATSKYTAENYCTCFYESYGVPCSVVRYSNVYGVNQSEKNPYCGVIGRFVTSALRGEDLLIHGDGLQTRDFTFASDAVGATIAVAMRTRAEGEVFNVATSIETSVLELAKKTIAIAGNRGSKIQHLDRRDIDNIRRRVLSIEKIRRMVRWTPSVALDNGLAMTMEWASRSMQK